MSDTFELTLDEYERCNLLRHMTITTPTELNSGDWHAQVIAKLHPDNPGSPNLDERNPIEEQRALTEQLRSQVARLTEERDALHQERERLWVEIEAWKEDHGELCTERVPRIVETFELRDKLTTIERDTTERIAAWLDTSIGMLPLGRLSDLAAGIRNFAWKAGTR